MDAGAGDCHYFGKYSGIDEKFTFLRHCKIDDGRPGRYFRRVRWVGHFRCDVAAEVQMNINFFISYFHL